MTPEFILTQTPDSGFEVIAVTKLEEARLNWCPTLWDAYREIGNYVTNHMPRFRHGFNVQVLRPVVADDESEVVHAV